MGDPLIICYHGVSSVWPNPTAIPEHVLEQQLQLLRRRRYVGYTLSGLVAGLAAGALAERSVAITFDDGYASTFRAEPILREAGYPATVFTVTRFVESGARFSWPGIEEWQNGSFTDELLPLSWEQIDGLVAAGWEIGSHGRTHAYLPALGVEALEEELAGSRDAVIRHVGSCDAFAYPYGAVDERVVDAVRRAGYTAACAVSLRASARDPYRLPRVGLYGRDTGLRFRAKLVPLAYAVASRWHDRRHGNPERPGPIADRLRHVDTPVRRRGGLHRPRDRGAAS